MEDKKKRLYAYIAFGILTCALLWFRTRNGTWAGSKIDWISQHTAFAEYFRRRFYQTHDFFPQFASEISGGVSIYYFAYYGLMNPFYLLSYAFPWISMTTWVTAMSVICYWLDGCLTIRWLSHNFSFIPSLCGALVLMLSSSLVYQSSAQVMFVSYMPFLIGLLSGADQRRKKRSWLRMFLCTVGIILNSFFYIPACFLVLCIYIWASQNVREKRLSDFIYNICPAFEGGLAGIFYLLPVTFALLNGRSSSSGAKSSLLSLLFPKFYSDTVLYNPYGIGITLSGLWILCVMVNSRYRKSARMSRAMALCIAAPILIYLLNGTLYVRGKVLIPFIVLIAYVCARFVHDLTNRRVNKLQCLQGTLLLVLLFLLAQTKNVLLVLAVSTAGLLLSLAVRYASRIIPFVLIGSMAVCSVYVLNQRSSSYLTTEELETQHDSSVVNAIQKAVSIEDGYYRAEVRGTSYLKDQENMILVSGQNITTGYSSLNNPYYLSVRKWLSLGQTTRNVFMLDAQDNPIFLRLMGVKYLVGETNMTDYKKIQDNLYVNTDVAPVFYLTSQVTSENTFNDMNWAWRQLNLLQTASVPSSTSRTSDTAILENLDVVLDHDSNIISNKETETTITFSHPLKEKTYLFLSFSVKNHAQRDVTITINQVRNRLSASNALYYNGNTEFHYVFSLPAGTESLSVTLSAGDYTIQSLQAMTGNVSASSSEKLYENPVKMYLDEDGNGFHGDTTNSEGHWLITSIPYSDEFTIIADGKEITPQKVNHGFLGAYFEQAPKHIEIRFRAKGSYEGLAMSAVFLILVPVMHWREKRKIRI